MGVFEIFLLTLGLTVVMIYWVWIYAVKIENFGVIDAAWSGGFTIQAVLFCMFSSGHPKRRLLLLALICLWSIRLAYFLFHRIKSHHPQEDTRYAKLREDYGSDYRRRFLIFFMIQAVSISVLTFPAIYVFNNSQASLNSFEIIGTLLFVVSLLGEAIADHQAGQFKSKPENKGKVCNVGLWKYSRHPNYFFETCIWFSFYIFILGTPGMWWAVYAPLTILALLLKVTGVPPSEAQSLKSRGDAYKEYQRKTSVFVPWFPKN